MKRVTIAFLAIIAVLSIAAVSFACMAAYKAPDAMPIALAQNAGGTNSISGTVYDARHNAVPGAKVTLYYTKFIVNDYKAADMVSSKDNPQTTSDGRQLPTGLYTFTSLDPDVYILTVEKDGIAYSQKVQVVEGGGTKTLDLTIPGYIERNYTASPTSTGTPGPTLTTVVPHDDAQTGDPGAIILGLLRLFLIGIICVQFLFGIVTIVLHLGRQG